jgi:hypothetical protein
VTEYLWADGMEIWTEDKMTRVFSSRSKAAIGIKLDVQSWRQIAVGIAIKKFGGLGYEFDADEDEKDEEMAGPMPEAFHWQASHTPRVGNQVYGGTVNFQGSLTDAGLQEYLHISQIWHKFLQDRPGPLLGSKHSRQQSDGLHQVPLAKQIACREGPQQCRRSWSMGEAQVALEQMYGPGAKYKTAKQEEAIQAVVSGVSPVITILGTGEGKSLLYMLPQ